MNSMDDTKEKSDQLGKRLGTITADLKMYIEKRVELILLNIGEHLASWIAASVYRLSGAIILLLGICFLLVSLALYVGELVGSEPLGYLLVGFPLLIFGWLFLYLKPAALIKIMEESLESEVIKAVSKVEDKVPPKLSRHPESKSESN